jgi:aspartate aminotransferase
MTFKFAQRMGRFVMSPSAQTSQRARELKAEGHDIIALSSGEPDFPTPEHVVEAAYRAARAGQTKYTTTSGNEALKDAVIEKFRRDNGLSYNRSEIIVSAGAKQVLFNVFMATLEGGDEVIVPSPYWISYVQIPQLAGARPVIVPCSAENGFKLTADGLASAITEHSRWLILNSPSNPAGSVYSAAELAALADVLRAHPHVGIVTDDIYEHIVFDGRKFSTIAEVAPDLKGRTLTVNGASKTYAMTGWRIGYAGGPSELITEMIKVQSQSTSGPCSVSQAAVIAALEGRQDLVAERAKAFETRRDLVLSMLNQTDGLQCRRPEGAFYVFADCNALLGRRTPDGEKVQTSNDFVRFLMDRHGVATVQGEAYGCDGHFRISIAASEDDLTEACARIQAACAALR